MWFGQERAKIQIQKIAMGVNETTATPISRFVCNLLTELNKTYFFVKLS